jgi:hypothetical protein
MTARIVNEAGFQINAFSATESTTSGTFGYRRVEAIGVAAADGFLVWELQLLGVGAGGIYFVDDMRVFVEPDGDTAVEDNSDEAVQEQFALATHALALVPEDAATLEDRIDRTVETKHSAATADIETRQKDGGVFDWKMFGSFNFGGLPALTRIIRGATNALRWNATAPAADIEYYTAVRRTKFVSLGGVAGTSFPGSSNFIHTFLLLGSVAQSLRANQVNHNSFALTLDLDRWVPDGSSLVEVQLGFQLSAGDIIGADLELWEDEVTDDVTVPFVSPTNTSLAKESIGAQTSVFQKHVKLSDASASGSLPQTLNYATKMYRVRLDGTFSGVSTLDITYIKIVYDDPGPGGR